MGSNLSQRGLCIPLLPTSMALMFYFQGPALLNHNIFNPSVAEVGGSSSWTQHSAFIQAEEPLNKGLEHSENNPTSPESL